MTEQNAESRFSAAGLFFILLLVIPLLLFAPLILSFAEHFTLGTDHVYQFCDQIGIADFLGDYIYRPVIRFFQKLF